MVRRTIHSVFRLLEIAAWVLLSAGCEQIGEGERLIAVSLPGDTTGRGHVLVEFTGFRCVNCPKASQEAETLRQTYGENLIVVAMHPASNPFTQGAAKYDYTCEEADVYYTYMGGLATTPFPIGNIDFRHDGHGYLNDYSDWATLAAEAMSEHEQASLNIKATYEADKLTIRTSCRAKMEQECRLILWLVEDSVQGAQALPDGSVTTEYTHRHMLRRAIGDPWGETVTASTTPAEQTATATLAIEDKRRYRIIAILMNADKQIINAKQTTIQ